MPPSLVLKEVVFPMETTLITLALAQGTEESRVFGAMDFPFVALETGFIAERCFGAWRLGASVWTSVLILVLSGIL